MEINGHHSHMEKQTYCKVSFMTAFENCSVNLVVMRRSDRSCWCILFVSIGNSLSVYLIGFF